MTASLVLVAGPYRSGTNDSVLIAKNVEAMTSTSLALFSRRPPAGDGRVVCAAADRARELYQP
jgi:hypothetical protein